MRAFASGGAIAIAIPVAFCAGRGAAVSIAGDRAVRRGVLRAAATPVKPAVEPVATGTPAMAVPIAQPVTGIAVTAAVAIALPATTTAGTTMSGTKPVAVAVAASPAPATAASTTAPASTASLAVAAAKDKRPAPLAALGLGGQAGQPAGKPAPRTYTKAELSGWWVEFKADAYKETRELAPPAGAGAGGRRHRI